MLVQKQVILHLRALESSQNTVLPKRMLGQFLFYGIGDIRRRFWLISNCMILDGSKGPHLYLRINLVSFTTFISSIDPLIYKQETGRVLGGTVFWLDSSLLNSSFSVSYSSSVMYVFSELIQLNKEQNIASNMKNFDNFSTIFAGISKQLSFCMNRSIRDTYH